MHDHEHFWVIPHLAPYFSQELSCLTLYSSFPFSRPPSFVLGCDRSLPFTLCYGLFSILEFASIALAQRIGRDSASRDCRKTFNTCKIGLFLFWCHYFSSQGIFVEWVCERASCYTRANLPRTILKSYRSWLVAICEGSIPTCTVVSPNTMEVYVPRRLYTCRVKTEVPD